MKSGKLGLSRSFSAMASFVGLDAGVFQPKAEALSELRLTKDRSLTNFASSIYKSAYAYTFLHGCNSLSSRMYADAYACMPELGSFGLTFRGQDPGIQVMLGSAALLRETAFCKTRFSRVRYVCLPERRIMVAY